MNNQESNSQQPKTTVIFDGSVVARYLPYCLSNIAPENHLSVVKAQMTWIVSLEWMGDYKPDNANIVFVQDLKRDREYWRHAYLRLPSVYEKHDADRLAHHSKRGKPKHKGEFKYKEGRKKPDASFKQLKADFYKICKERGWATLGYTDKGQGKPFEPDYLKPIGYEADDIAAAITWVNNQRSNPNTVWLATIDADWLGMVNDHTHWICTSNHHPRVRANLSQINEWADHRLGVTLSHPSTIWHYKALNGDPSDNLPIHSPIEVIDLYNPPDQFKVWQKPGMTDKINAILDSEPPTVSNVNKATEYLRRLGVSRCIPKV